MSINIQENNEDVKNSNKSNIFNISILIVSLLSVIIGLFIGLALVMQYYMQGKPNFAIFTFSFIFVPSLVVQIISAKLYFVNNDMKPFHWLHHLLLLGMIYRYITSIKKCVNNLCSVKCSESDSVTADLNHLKNLYLYKTFMEDAPQLILQFYILAKFSDNMYLTKVSVSASIFSLAWSLIIHTKLRKGNYLGLIWLILWRFGMISARASALVLCAYICGPWIILFIGAHWLAMILWITYQKSASEEKKKKGEFHSAIFGLIYCFCFFTLKIGQPKWQAVTLNLLFLFENVVFLTVFLTCFSAGKQKLAVASSVIVIFGSLLGLSSLLVYYVLFQSKRTWKSSMEFSRSVKNNGKEVNFSEESYAQNENPHVQTYSDSVIAIEENPTPEKLDISKEDVEQIYEEPNEIKMESEGTQLNLPVAIKRRAICSSVDLKRFVRNKTDSPEMEDNIVIPDELSSEILSTRDYENICAVNIAREPWGIRSWRGYSDIETLRHDGSVVNEGRLDNLTTSSEYSGKFEDRDSLFVSENKFNIDTTNEKASLNILSPVPSSILEAIFEEEVSKSNLFSDGDREIKRNCKSTLVATIDKICLYTPLRTRSPSISNFSVNTEAGRMIENDVKRVEKPENVTVKRKLCMTAEKQETFSPLKSKFRSIQKLNVFREKYEINRYHIESNVSTVKVNRTLKDKEGDKENLTTDKTHEITEVGSKTGRGNNGSDFREKSLILKDIITPSKSEKPIFQVCYSKG